MIQRNAQQVFLAAVAALVLPVGAFAATLHPAEKRVLVAYLGALQHERYADAFRLLQSSERAYFRNPTNYASIFKADALRIETFRVVGSRNAGPLGTLALVSENIAFLDQAHQAPGTATVTVPYGLVSSTGSYRIKDPYHPWKAIRTSGVEATAGGVRATVRKVSFFAGRIEVLITFANAGNGFVTLLPYGRTVLRDEADHVYHPVATRLSGLTDKQLYLGLRLASNAQYTGALNFAVPATRSPRRLDLTIAPTLRDGADAPFEIGLPPIEIP